MPSHMVQRAWTRGTMKPNENSWEVPIPWYDGSMVPWYLMVPQFINLLVGKNGP